jgi:hypothetical protein
VITSSIAIATPVWADTGSTPIQEPKPSLLRRALDDPYWILMALTAVLGLSITATVVYGIIHIRLAIGQWLHANGAVLGAITALIITLMLCGGATAAKCAGIHCGRCKG